MLPNYLIVMKPFINNTPQNQNKTKGRKSEQTSHSKCSAGHGHTRDSLFILGRNHWLNMTGRKWESEAGDASRYCQITGRMRQISLFLHLVLVISLASFSSLISVVWRYVVGVAVVGGWGVSSTLHLQWRAVNCLKPQCLPKLSLAEYKWLEGWTSPCLFHRTLLTRYCGSPWMNLAIYKWVRNFLHLWKLLHWHRWIYLRKR